MMANGLVTVTISTILFGFAICQQPPRRPTVPAVPEVPQDCLDCICQGSSDCDTSLKCHTAGPSYFCGPYVISWAYWHDGGRPGDKGRAHDFENCLNNKTCAEQAIKGYMKKHGRDCDQDGAISCYDFARIHKTGPGGCSSNSIDSSDYWQKFLICYEGDGGSYDYGQQGSFYSADSANDEANVNLDARRYQS